MSRIVHIDTAERPAVVQPGVVNDDLRAACAEHGLRYPPDPTSSPWSTIGGNAATDAGGMHCVKYGVTLDYVLGLEVVNGLGEVVSLGRRTAKGVAGYDVAGLMVGAEGTLGLITVRPRPARPQEMAEYFSSVVAAGEAVSAVTASGVIPSALELVDRHSLAAVDTWKRMGLSADADVVLLGRVDAPGAEGDKELGSAVLGMHHAVKAALDPHGILNPGKVLGMAWSSPPGEGDAPRA